MGLKQAFSYMSCLSGTYCLSKVRISTALDINIHNGKKNGLDKTRTKTTVVMSNIPKWGTEIYGKKTRAIFLTSPSIMVGVVQYQLLERRLQSYSLHLMSKV